MIGRFQHEQGQYDVAVRTLELALRLTDPALRGGHAVALTMCLIDAGQYRKALSAFRAAARDQADFFTLASEFILWLVSDFMHQRF